MERASFEMKWLTAFTNTFLSSTKGSEVLSRLRNKITKEFPIKVKPLKAKSNKAVTQLAYAKAGIITPEMEFISIRENQLRNN